MVVLDASARAEREAAAIEAAAVPSAPAPRAPRPGVRAALALVPAEAVSIAAAALVCAGFFLPWMDGAGPFALRSFSGFDFARLVRNFEITADTASSSAQVRGSAVAIYLVPAAAVNAAVLHALARFAGLSRRAAAAALVIASAYVLAVLGLVLVLSLAPLNGFASAVGLPSWGFALTLAGALALGGEGLRTYRT